MAKITIKAKVTDDSKAKLQMLEDEYRRFQAYLHGVKEVKLYSATKQQADRLLARIAGRGGKLNPKKEYPLILRRDLIDTKKDSRFPSVYWMKVPIYPKSINLRIQTDCRHDLTLYSLRESKVVKSDDEEWYIYITIEKAGEEPKPATNVLAIDLGVRHIAVTTNSANIRPNFYGAEIPRIRGFYFNLRRKLGQKKAFYKIKAVKDNEFKQVNHKLHEISKAVVEEAVRTNAVIVVGKLKGIRSRIRGSRRVRRLLNNFPYFRLVQYIRYKAEWLGIRVVEVSEAYTSQTCHNCHVRDKAARKTQGLYKCSNCGLETNADYNGSRNILQRALGTLSRVGGQLTSPELSVMACRSHVITKESPALQGGE